MPYKLRVALVGHSSVALGALSVTCAEHCLEAETPAFTEFPACSALGSVLKLLGTPGEIWLPKVWLSGHDGINPPLLTAGD